MSLAGYSAILSKATVSREYYRKNNMEPQRARSIVWRYFEIIPEDTCKARCLLCNALISRGGIGKSAGTSCLRNHMKWKHSDVFSVATNFAPSVVSNKSCYQNVYYGGDKDEKVNIIGEEMQQTLIVEGGQAQMQAAG